MRIPRITLAFSAFLAETEKAILIHYDGKDVWLPKSICSDIRIKGDVKLNGTAGAGTVNIAPFKFEELSGVVPQSLDSLVIDEVADTLAYNTLPDYNVIEPKGIFLNEKQVDVVCRVKRLRHFFLYGQMRTGKTVVATTIAQSRMDCGIIDRLIVIAPLRTRSVWESHLSIPFDFFATEHFSNEHTRDDLHLDCDSRTMVILDESHQIKNNKTLRVDLIVKQTEQAGQRCILTGTPIGKHAGDLYHQFRFLDPAILQYKSYADFESMHLLYGGREGKTVVAYTGIEEISRRISPYTAIMRRSDMGIDREKKYEVVTYKASNMERYNELKDRYKEAYESHRSNSALGYMVKLQQCAVGYEIDEQDQCVGHADNGRRECLRSILDRFHGTPVVVYFKYNDDLDDLRKLGIPILSGKTSRRQFDETIADFNAGKINVICLQQQLSIGFSLRTAGVMIYYSRKFGSISSAQSEDRACERSDVPLTIVDIAAKDTIDEVIKSTITKQFDIINILKSSIE